jgi:hypothetical protein
VEVACIVIGRTTFERHESVNRVERLRPRDGERKMRDEVTGERDERQRLRRCGAMNVNAYLLRRRHVFAMAAGKATGPAHAKSPGNHSSTSMHVTGNKMLRDGVADFFD